MASVAPQSAVSQDRWIAFAIGSWRALNTTSFGAERTEVQLPPGQRAARRYAGAQQRLVGLTPARPTRAQ